ncbi:MAG: phosphotransferase family protein [Cumulibacter sp.]
MAQAEDFKDRAHTWARDQYGTDVTIAGFGAMPGNSGLSFGFAIHGADGVTLEEVVVRLAPPGVKRSGNTDVLHQVPLLRALEQTEVPVAPVLWHASEDTSPFETDTMVQRKMPGRSLNMFSADARSPQVSTELLVDNAIGALATLHQVDDSALHGTWDDIVPLRDDLAYWFRLIEKVGDPELIDLGTRLRDALIAQEPTTDRRGIFHGDFQTNNVLFADDGSVSAIVDWEIAGIGYSGVDVGWMSMMTDPSYWGPEYQAGMRLKVDPARIRATYETHAGQSIPSFDWYAAYSGYRFGSIAGYNLRLHRTGRRPDPVYEVMASSVPQLFRRGIEVLGA